MSRFPAAFRPPAFASRSSYSRRGLGLPYGRLTGHRCPDPVGVSTFHTYEIRPGWVPPVPRGRRCSSRPTTFPQPAPAASQRPVPTPRYQHPICGARLTRHQRRFTQFTRPAFPSPVTPGWNGGPWAFPRASHPAVTSDARQGGDRLRARARNYALDISRTSNHRNPLVTCDLVSQQARPMVVGPIDPAGSSRRREDSTAYDRAGGNPIQSTRMGAASSSTPARTCTSLRSDRGCSTTSIRSSTRSRTLTCMSSTLRVIASATIARTLSLTVGCASSWTSAKNPPGS